MSLRYKGGVISATPPTTSTTAATGVWTLEQQMQAQAAGTWPLSQYQIQRSLRFNPDDSPYLSRTPASSGNQTTWTFSCWYKKCGEATSTNQAIIATGLSGTDYSYIGFSNNTPGNIFHWDAYAGGPVNGLETSAVYRDPSAWYHLVFVYDSGNATSTDRLRMYINGVRISAFSYTDYPSLNETSKFNSNIEHRIGQIASYVSSSKLNGYLTEVQFIDGQALTASSFGDTDATTGVWKPKPYAGTYGTNGYYLNFSDNSGTTSTTLGKDLSGNGNNWTPNNFSVTAGTGNDSLVDTPTPYGTDTGAGGEVRGNYGTWNPLWTHSSITLANGNLQATGASSSNGLATGTIAISSGKWYWESTVLGGSSMWAAGIVKTTIATPNYSSLTTDSSYAWNDTASKYNGQTASSYGASYTTNDVIGIAVDLDAGTVVFYKNGSSQGTAFTGVSGTFVPMVLCNNTASVATNFGQRPFAYTAPSGYKALCTTNLPTPTIGATATTRADDYFNTVLYTGTGSQQTISGVGFQPDFTWIKKRSATGSHVLIDAVRGGTKQLFSNLTNAEQTDTDITNGFASDGFIVGANSGAGTGSTNENTDTYVGWNWKANGAGSSNTAGTITSTVSANTTSGFSVVTYTGNGTSNSSVGHGLGATPVVAIIKSRSQSGENWHSYWSGLGQTKDLQLNTTDAAFTYTSPNIWGSTSWSSTLFYLGNQTGINSNGSTYVAYCFAPVAGYSAFGSYPGNGVDPWPGVFVYTGFKPAWVLIKGDNGSNAYYSWGLLDIDRNTNNQGYNNALWANRSAAEGKRGNGTDTPGTGDFQLSFTANGFCVSGSGAELNASNATYYWAAFAENPFKYALAR